MDIKWWDHFIDFWVIFGADVFAAFIAIKLFEARHADRERTEKSLSRLHQLANGLHSYYWRERAKITPNNTFVANISGDLTDDRRGFEELNDDLLFWSFRVSQPFQEKYESIRTVMGQVHHQLNAGDLKATLADLLDQLKTLSGAIVQELKSKKSRCFWK